MKTGLGARSLNHWPWRFAGIFIHHGGKVELVSKGFTLAIDKGEGRG